MVPIDTIVTLLCNLKRVVDYKQRLKLLKVFYYECQGMKSNNIQAGKVLKIKVGTVMPLPLKASAIGGLTLSLGNCIKLRQLIYFGESSNHAISSGSSTKRMRIQTLQHRYFRNAFYGIFCSANIYILAKLNYYDYLCLQITLEQADIGRNCVGPEVTIVQELYFCLYRLFLRHIYWRFFFCRIRLKQHSLLRIC